MEDEKTTNRGTFIGQETNNLIGLTNTIHKELFRREEAQALTHDLIGLMNTIHKELFRREKAQELTHEQLEEINKFYDCYAIGFSIL